MRSRLTIMLSCTTFSTNGATWRHRCVGGWQHTSGEGLQARLDVALDGDPERLVERVVRAYQRQRRQGT